MFLKETARERARRRYGRPAAAACPGRDVLCLRVVVEEADFLPAERVHPRDARRGGIARFRRVEEIGSERRGRDVVDRHCSWAAAGSCGLSRPDLADLRLVDLGHLHGVGGRRGNGVGGKGRVRESVSVPARGEGHLDPLRRVVLVAIVAFRSVEADVGRARPARSKEGGARLDAGSRRQGHEVRGPVRASGNGQVRAGPFAEDSPPLDRSDRFLPGLGGEIHGQGRIEPVLPLEPHASGVSTMRKARQPDVEAAVLLEDELLDDGFGGSQLAGRRIGVAVPRARASLDRLLGRLGVAEDDEQIGRGCSLLEKVLVVRGRGGRRDPERETRE